MKTSDPALTKRQFLGLLATAPAVSLSPKLFAGNAHAQHGTSYSKELVAAAEECISTGQACKTHIYQSMQSDDLSLTQSLLEVRNTIATC